MNCPCSIWGTNVTPKKTDSGDASLGQGGRQVPVDTSGTVTGIRFYKASANTGTHIGNLWTATGQLLASATFTNESASGWQQVNFSQPVAMNANTTYVASYFAPNGHYSQGRFVLLYHPADGDESHHHQRGQPAAACAAQHQRHRQRRSYSYSGSPTFPTSSAQCLELLGGPGLLPLACLFHAGS